ncbi:MAG: hypothetical protein U0X73_17385 [Thermoanaerobaculia bacterium]
MTMRIVPRISALLVVALPLLPDADRGSEAARAASQTALPAAEVIAAPAFAGAVGATLAPTDGGWRLCLSVLLRDASGTPVLGPASWRRAEVGTAAPQALERAYPRNLPKGYRLWSGCQRVDAAAGERALVELREPRELRESKWIEVTPTLGSWNWTPVLPFPSTVTLETAADAVRPRRR